MDLSRRNATHGARDVAIVGHNREVGRRHRCMKRTITRKGLMVAVLASSMACLVLGTAISREHDAAQARNQPTTIAAWIDALLPAGKKRHQHARAFYGLDGKRFAGVRALANSLGVTTAAIYAAIGKSRTEWSEHAAILGLAVSQRVRGPTWSSSRAAPRPRSRRRCCHRGRRCSRPSPG